MRLKIGTTLLFLISFLWAEAQTTPPNYTRVTDLILKQEYKKAEDLLVESRSFADSLFLSLIIKNSIMIDYESYAVDGNIFLEECSYADSVFSQELSNSKISLYKALILNTKSLCLVKRGDILNGIKASRESASLLKTILQNDPNNSLAKSSLALYNYYLSTTLKWIPFAGGSPEKQLVILENMATGNTVESHSVKQSLIWIYLENREFDKCDTTLQQLFFFYPQNSLAKRGEMHLYLRTGQLDKAKKVAESILKKSISRERKNWSDYFSAGAVLLEIATANEEWAKGAEIAKIVTAQKVDPKSEKIDWVIKHKKSIKDSYETIKKRL